MFLVAVSSTFGQTAPPTASSSPDGISISQSASVTPQRSAQHFVCSRDYAVEGCYKDVSVLRRTIAEYPGARVEEWTWVLVRSKDWKAIVEPRGLNPDSPAFTYSAKRETFIEEALVANVSGRNDELRGRWHLRADKLLELVIAHELGHAFCNDRGEAVANQQADRLQEGKAPSCEPNLETRTWRKRPHRAIDAQTELRPEGALYPF